MTIKHKVTRLLLTVMCLTTLAIPAVAYATDSCGDPHGNPKPVETSINIGCEGRGSPLADALFAIIRFLSEGVGLVIVGSLVFAGIQYTSSRGDPNATARAIGRIKTTVVALFIYIFGFAILNYVIPAGFFR